MTFQKPEDDAAFTEKKQRSLSETTLVNDHHPEKSEEPNVEKIDTEKLNSVLNMELKPWDIKLNVPDDEKDAWQSNEVLEEIAEDMLHIMERIKVLETKQTELIESVGQLHHAVFESNRTHAIELDKLRRELLGERKSLATRNAFNAILPSLDSLHIMKNGLDSERDSPIYAQLNAVISSLMNIIQGLGFMEFKATHGEPFDPARMECLGYSESEIEGVAEVVRSGYQIQDMIVRPCGVLITKSKEPTNGKEGK